MIQRPPHRGASCKEWARYYHSLGLRPLPVRPGTKYPAVKWTKYQMCQPSLEEIENWDWSGGIGIMTTGVICVDCDRGAEHLIAERKLDFPPSWTVRTGSGGLHRYYKADGQPGRNATAILKEDGKGQVDIRADGGFIIVPPTRHIQTGKPYEWILPPWGDSAPLASSPAWIREAIADRDRPRKASDGQEKPAWVSELMQGVPEGQRNEAAARLAGYFVEKHPEDITLEILRPFSERCTPPMPLRELQDVVASIYRTHSRRGRVRVEEIPPEGDQAEELPAEAPEIDMPLFPEAAYLGLAGEIADTYSEYLEAPKEFFFMDTLTFLGGLLSTQVRLDSELREEPRLYVVKVAPSWSGRKSSSQETIEWLLTPILQERMKMCYGAGSAEGLQRIMQSGLPTMLMYDEFRAFVDKAGVQQSVLLPMVATLFHRTVYENSTKTSEIRLTNAHLSLIGACTTETFTTMFSPAFRNIGFLNRLFVVTGERKKFHPIPQAVPSHLVKRLQERVLAQIEKAERDKPALHFTTGAQRRWEEWYRAMPVSPYAARLDTYGFRLLMLYAVNTESWEITQPLIDAVISLLDYELEVRRELDPVDAEGVTAKMERLILKHLGKGLRTESKLQALCNVRYYGVWSYGLALKNVIDHGWVRRKRAGKGHQLWLTEAGYEAAKQ